MLVTSAAGVGVLGGDGRVRFDFSPAIASADGSVIVSAHVSSDAANTVVDVHDGHTGAVRATVTVPGEQLPAAVNARRVALVSTIKEPTATVEDGYIAGGRRTTRVTIVDIERGKQIGSWELNGNFMPEAFTSSSLSSSLADSLVLLEYLPPERPTSYRVRWLQVDGTTTELQLPSNWTEKGGGVDEQMQGFGRTHVLSPSGEVLYTLYRAPSTSQRAGHAFIHTLGLDIVRVYCLDLPDDLGFADVAGALATNADGSKLYAVNATGHLVEITVRGERLGDQLAPPIISRTVDLGVDTDRGPMASITTTQGAIWVMAGTTVLKVDPRTLAVVERTTVPVAASALGIWRGAPIVAGGTEIDRRLPTGQWVPAAELPLTLATPQALRELD